MAKLRAALTDAHFDAGFLRLELERTRQENARLQRDVENLTAQLEQEILRSRNREPQFDNADCGTF
jgi:DNA anti-recombination protein RmuC